MSCIHLESGGDTCGMFCKGEAGRPLGVDSRGGCRVYDDPNPHSGCDTYELVDGEDMDECLGCGNDINGEGCSCD